MGKRRHLTPIDRCFLGRYLDTEMIRNVKCPTCGKSTPDSSFCEYCGKALYSCKACGTTIAKDALFCPDCGKAVTVEGRELKARENVSAAWWLLPIIPIFLFSYSTVVGLFVGCIGGVAAWAFNRKKDPVKARSMLWLGLSFLIISFILIVILTSIGEKITPVG